MYKKNIVLTSIFCLFLLVFFSQLSNADTDDAWAECGSASYPESTPGTCDTYITAGGVKYCCCADPKWYEASALAGGVCTGGPTCSVSSISESSDYSYSSGTTVWYNTVSTGNFDVNVNANSDIGISKATFPNTVSAGGDDTSSPYSWSYTWSATDTYSSAATVTVYDTIDQTGTCEFTVTRDVIAPTTSAAVSGSYTITLSCTDNSGGSGCDQTEYCTDITDTCDPTTTYSSPFTESCAETCYVRYNSTDKVNNVESIKSDSFGPGGEPPEPEECIPDGCNYNCPSECTYADDPDCGCVNNDNCCGVGCTSSNDNDCGTCTDSDGGFKPKVMGTCRHEPPGGGVQTFTDSCNGFDSVNEYYCSDVGLCVYESFTCADLNNEWCGYYQGWSGYWRPMEYNKITGWSDNYLCDATTDNSACVKGPWVIPDKMVVGPTETCDTQCEIYTCQFDEVTWYCNKDYPIVGNIWTPVSPYYDTEVFCDNGYDDDCDGLTDSADPDCREQFTYTMSEGWNLISPPFGNIEIVEDGCDATNSKFYWLDNSGKWVIDTIGIDNLETGYGYFFYSKKNCAVTISGIINAEASEINLISGWTQIGAPREGLTDLSSIPNYDAGCEFLWWNPTTKSWDEKTTLEEGKGYRAMC